MRFLSCNSASRSTSKAISGLLRSKNSSNADGLNLGLEHCVLQLPTRALFHSAAVKHQGNVPIHTGRPKLVILGTGWGASRLARDIDCKLYDLSVVSPRNHMVFTPMLASVCVGTVEPRSVAVSILNIQPHLKGQFPHKYYAAFATSVDYKKREVHAQDDLGASFTLSYDKLVIATGSQGSTFGIPGVEQFTNFLRDVRNAEDIRFRLIRNWQKSNIPGRSREERERLLHTVIVGGGPTGVETAGELSDLLASDLKKIDPVRARDMKITLVEASELLGSFDGRLREYAARKLQKQGVTLIKGVVKEVTQQHVELQDGDKIPFGLCIWSTGVGPTPFTTSLPFAKTGRGRLAVNDTLNAFVHAGPVSQEGGQGTEIPAPGGKSEDAKVAACPDVYALGDCCANQKAPLPALAQVAEQQGKYLAHLLNGAKGGGGTAGEEAPPFRYRSLGALATVGRTSAVMDLHSPRAHISWAGFISWLAWRSAYLTRIGSLRNRLYVAVNWATTLLMGRDISAW